MIQRLEFHYNDGGRAEAGFKGTTGDCVVRSVAIATGRPYKEIYEALSMGASKERKPKRGPQTRSARNGVHVKRKWFKTYMESLGWKWVPTMQIGQGCKVHFIKNELPVGTLIVSLSKHYTCVIDGVVHDIYHPERGPTYYYENGAVHHISPDRCVYGYWIKENSK